MEKDVWIKSGLSAGTLKLILGKVKENTVEWLSTKNNLLIIMFGAPLSEKRIYKVSSEEIEKLKNEISSVKSVTSFSYSATGYDIFFADGSTCSYKERNDGSKLISYNKGGQKNEKTYKKN